MRDMAPVRSPLRCALAAVIVVVTGLAVAGDRLLQEERYSEAFGAAVAVLETRLRDRGALHPDTITALQQVGRIAYLGGDQRTAEEVLGAALAARRRVLHDDAALAEILVTCARASRYRERTALAKTYLDEADRLLRAMPHPPAYVRAELFQDQGNFARVTEGPAAAIPFYRAALAERRRDPHLQPIDLADTLAWLAWHLSKAGQGEEARTKALEAGRLLDALGLRTHRLRATVDGVLGDQEVLAGHPERAVPYWREIAAIREAVRAKQLGGFARRRFPLDGYERLALAALRDGRGEEAWTLMERGIAAAHVDFATFALWHRRDPVTWGTWRRTQASLEDVRRRLQSTPWSASSAPLFTRVLRLRADLHELERRFLLAHRPRVPSRAAVDAALGPKGALLGWLDVSVGDWLPNNTPPVRNSLMGYVLRPGKPVTWVPLWETRAPGEFDAVLRFGNVFESLRRAASWRRRVEPDPELDAALRAWGAHQVDPILPLLKGVDHLVIESAQEPADLARLADGSFLGDHFDVTYIPSAQLLPLLAERQTGASPRRDRVLAVSGPSEARVGQSIASLVDMKETERSHRQLRSAYVRERMPLAQLPRLRYAAMEVRAVGGRFAASTVLTDQSSVDRTLDLLAEGGELRRFGVVHLAAHTLTDAAPEGCALALADRPRAGQDGLLEVEDILLEWDLDADLLVLSGCETMRAAGLGRGDPFGFLPALFRSGARRILSSVWTVDDRATAILMDRFYENYRRKAMSPARALREAKTYLRTLQDAQGHRPFAHPAYWAGFVLVGLP